MNSAEIKILLNAQIEGVCQHLLPGGKRKGHEWCCGSTAGDAGESMKVRLDGEKAGVWKDYAGSADDAGDVFDLWMRVRGLDFVETIKQAKAYLGIADASKNDFRPISRQNKAYVQPRLDEIQPVLSSGAVFEYLTKTRKIDPETLHRYKIGQIVHSRVGDAMAFSIYEPTGKTVDMVKYLAVNRPEGKKFIWSTADSRPHLFGWQAIRPDAREVVICEGEIDCLTIAGWGFPTLSVPQGAGNMDWVESDYEELERFEKIIVCVDSDEPGQKLAAQIVQRLGRERCFLVSLGEYKDANEALCAGQFLDVDFEDVVASARTLDPVQLKSAGDFGDDAWESVYPSSQRTAGTETPFAVDWRCRFGEATIWTGWSGHGKSHVLNQFMVHDAFQGEKGCIASFEMDAGDTVAQLIRMTMAGFPEQKNRAEINPALEWLSSRIWLIDEVGVMHWKKLIPILTYAARRYGCTRFAVDSLLRLGVAEDDYNQQKDAIEAFVLFARQYGHVHIVCHARKGDDESKAPGKHDVRGGAGMTDLIQNGITFWRNKSKEQKLEEIKNSPTPMSIPSNLVMQPDAQISWWKQRKKGDEPFRRLWLNKKSAQFLESSDRWPKNYLT